MHSNALSSQPQLMQGYASSGLTAMSKYADEQHSSSNSNNTPMRGKDSADISSAGQAALAEEEQANQKATHAEEKEHTSTSEEQSLNGQTLSPVDIAVVKELQQRDQEVRQHEQAHKAVAGSYAIGGPSYEYQTGPDGKRYAVGGHVNIDTGKESDPEATIAKMNTVKRAALAPASPSSQDRAVAAAATQKKNQATIELRELQREEAREEARGNDEVENTDASDTTANTDDDETTVSTTVNQQQQSNANSDAPLENPAERQHINLSA